MPIWYGSSDWNPPKSFLSRLEVMNETDRLVAENQFAQLVVVRIFRRIYSRLNSQQKQKFLKCIESNMPPKELELTFQSIIPDIHDEINNAVNSVYFDLTI